MEELNNKNVAEAKPLAASERIDMNKVAQDFTSIYDLRQDIEEIVHRLLSLCPERDDEDEKKYVTTIYGHLNGLTETVEELCYSIFREASLKYSRHWKRQ